LPVPRGAGILWAMLELDSAQEFRPAFDVEFFDALPARPGVFQLMMNAENARPYLARTADLRAAATRLLSRPEAGVSTKRLNLRDVAASMRYRVTGSKFEQSIALYENARREFPAKYRDVVRLRPPAVLKINLRNSYPRCYVTRKIRGDEGFYFGPFQSRQFAEEFSTGLLDLFKTRRCQIKILRDPTFPGCIYSEMKMCLAPCFAGCTSDDYQSEVAQLLATLDSSGESLTDSLEAEREKASEDLDFERAALLHKRLEKASAALRGLPEIAGPIAHLDAVILQKGAAEKTIVAFPVFAGMLGAPLTLNFGDVTAEPRSAESLLKRALEPEAFDASGEPIQRAKAKRAKGEAEPAAQGESQAATTAEASSAEAAGREVSALESSAPPQHADLRHADLRAEARARYGVTHVSPLLSEHLSLVSRWFYSKPRDGEILFKDDLWPYRRIMRACSRLLAPPAEIKPVDPAEPTAPPA
jgi:excinuclease ABC subunit C